MPHDFVAERGRRLSRREGAAPPPPSLGFIPLPRKVSIPAKETVASGGGEGGGVQETARMAGSDLEVPKLHIEHVRALAAAMVAGEAVRQLASTSADARDRQNAQSAAGSRRIVNSITSPGRSAQLSISVQ